MEEAEEEQPVEEKDPLFMVMSEPTRKSDVYKQVNSNNNNLKIINHTKTEQVKTQEEFNINETPLKSINTIKVSSEEKENICNDHVKCYYSEHKINTKKRASTPVKRTIIEEEKKKKKYETQMKNETNLKTEENEDNTYMCNITPMKGKIPESQHTPLKRKAKNVETINKNIPLSKKKKFSDLKSDASPLLKGDTNYSLNKTPLKENPKKNKKKTSVYEEKFYMHTPVRGKNKNRKSEKECIQNGIDSNAVNEKGEIDGILLHELPEHVKNEYVSYLCSPLKRSERIIKTKINKMLNTHKEKEKKNVQDQTKEKKENKEIENEGTFKNSKDVNEMACDFFPEHEEKCWDEFYTRSVDKAKPFTGITTETAVHIITQLLKSNIKKIKVDGEESYSPISENDTIMEIGHGTHPLAVEMYKQWGTVGRYIGIEFSGAASTEALNCMKLKKLLIERKIEFIKILNMNYYENGSLNGIVVESNISPKNTKTDFIKMYSFKYIFAKSTLDYITCRLDNTGNSTHWEDDLQISPTVVQMFNSLSDSLQNCSKPNNTTNSNGNKNYTTSSNTINKKNSYIIFVEPSDPAKFRDHILTIFKVIYTATFKYNSSAKYLKLVKILNLNKASGYMIEKRNEVFQNFEEMREETTKLISKSSYFKYIDDSDWFLPLNEPKKWISSDPDDIEYMVNLDNGNL